jgi:hypothetical protein
MEAARTARLKGHAVTLFEAGPNLGGQLLTARRAPFLHSIGDIAHWLEQEIYRLGVEVRTGSYVEAEEILAQKPDLVVIATGSIARHDGIQYRNPEHPVPGFDQPHVISAVELLSPQQRDFGRTALVFDDVGHYEAVAAAEFLLSKGLEVTFVTRYPVVAPQLDFITRIDPAFSRFAATNRFRLLIRSQIARIRARDCEVSTLYLGDPQIVPADTVVFVSAKQPLRAVYDELREHGFRQGQNLTIVGDARAPRDLQFAITEGHRLVRELT